MAASSPTSSTGSSSPPTTSWSSRPALPDGEDVVYEVERPEGESLGVELEPPTVRRCANRCEFCFIEGLPKGLRKPLYIRDDDYRLSFAYGNFATLSNVKERDIARILEYRLSPLYVSVHATPWEARKVLLNNPRVPNIVEQLTRLADGRHPVPLPDGDRARAQRRRRARGSRSATCGTSATPCSRVAVVPVGLTQFSHLYTGKPMDARERTHAARRRRAVGRARPRRARRARVGVRLRRAVSARRASISRAPSTTATSRRSRTASARSPRCAARARRTGRAAAARREADRRRHRRLDGGR